MFTTGSKGLNPNSFICYSQYETGDWWTANKDTVDADCNFGCHIGNLCTSPAQLDDKNPCFIGNPPPSPPPDSFPCLTAMELRYWIESNAASLRRDIRFDVPGESNFISPYITVNDPFNPNDNPQKRDAKCPMRFQQVIFNIFENPVDGSRILFVVNNNFTYGDFANETWEGHTLDDNVDLSPVKFRIHNCILLPVKKITDITSDPTPICDNNCTCSLDPDTSSYVVSFTTSIPGFNVSTGGYKIYKIEYY